MERKKVAWWVIGGIVFGLGALGRAKEKAATADYPPSVVVRPGSSAATQASARPSSLDCVLAADDKLVVLCPTQEGIEEFAKAQSDADAAMVVFRAKDCFGVPKRAKCLQLDSSGSWSKVRVLEGTQEGRAGWTKTRLTHE